MYIFVLLLLFAYVISGLIKNIIFIYDFVKRRQDTSTKTKLTETTYKKK